MALQIWLPLNGNLNNQGVSDATFSAYSNTTGMGVNTSGKLGGSCYERTAAAANGYRSSRTFLMDKDVSMCCWAYVSSTPGDSANGLITNHNHADGSGFGITVKQVSASDYRISCSEGRSGSDRTYCTHYGTSNIKDAWHHLGLTYQRASGTLKLYVDGICEKTLTGKTSAVASNPFDLFNWSTGNISSASYRATCKLNDVRLYDHCLSGREMSEIAKGLVAHYPLDNNGQGGVNLLTNGNSSVTNNNYDLNGYSPGPIMVAGEIYTLTICVTPAAGVTSYDAYVSSGYRNLASFTVNGTSKQIITRTFTASYYAGREPSVSSSHATIVLYRFPNNGTVTTNSTIHWAKLEKGAGETIAYWSPHFSATDFDKTIYDCSGYGYHGTIIGNLYTENNSPRYDCATVFDGSSAIICGRSAMVKDEITVNLWAYMSDWSNYSGGTYRIISCTEGGGWNVEPSSGKLCFACGTGSSTNAYKNAVSTTTLDNLSNGWHMITGTYNGLQTKIYIDGVLEGTNSGYTTKTPLFYNSSNGIFIGAEAGTSATTPGGQYFNGKISDVRIYAKALSATDIKEMYNTPISIGKTGAAMAYNFKEV